jgi:glycosyltransferase involved in cell wall biosynthesis
VNAVNVVGFGTSTVARNLLEALSRAAADVAFTAVVPDVPAYRALAVGRNLHLDYWARASRRFNGVVRLRQLHRDLPRAVAAASPDVCLTLGDIGPIRLTCPHVAFVHLAHLAYPAEYLSGRDAWGPLKRRYLERHFARMVRSGARVVVQTPVMAERIAARYDLAPAAVRWIPQPPPLEPLRPDERERCLPAMAGIDKRVRLLFPASFVAHKNHRILSAVVRELRKRGLAGTVGIFLTLDARAAARTIGPAERDVLFNLGNLDRAEMRAAYLASTGLFLPTLVESYGLPYLEALALRRPILTSDRDFARWMCGDLAIYFDPLDERSIVDAIARLSARTPAPDFDERASAHLRQFPADWDVVADGFLAVLRAAALQGQETIDSPALVDVPGGV